MFLKKLGTLFLYTLVGSQISIIVFLGLRLAQKTSQGVLGTSVAVYPMKKNLFEIIPSSNLKYFNEPIANTTQDTLVPWYQTHSTQTINSDRFNERFEYTTKKDPSTYRIITLGDSFTFGALVDTKQNYPELLEDTLNQKLHCKDIKKFEVINLGSPGYDILYSAERFKQRGEKYNPDLIVWFLIPNDFEEVMEYMFPYIEPMRKKMMLAGQQEKWQNQVYFPELMKAKARMQSEIGEKNLLDYYEKAILSLDDSYQNKLVFMSPSILDVKNQNILKSIVSKTPQKKSFLYLPSYPEDAFFPDSHPNEKGYELISKELYKFLTDKKIINCQSL